MNRQPDSYMRTSIRLAIATCAVVFGTLWLVSDCAAQYGPNGRRAFQRHDDLPWYNSESDSVKFVPPPKSPNPSNRSTNKGNSKGNGNFTPRRNTGGGSNQRNSQRGGGSFGAPSGGAVAGGSIVAVLFWIVVAIVLIAFAVGIIWAIIQMNKKDDEEEEQSELDVQGKKETSVERLPFKVNKPTGDLLQAARQAFGSGNYRDAIIYLYSHVLVTLDEKGLIVLTRGKTNRQYLREVTRHQPVADYLEDCMIPFEKAFFGDIAVGQSDVGPCLDQFDQFQQTVSNTNAVG